MASSATPESHFVLYSATHYLILLATALVAIGLSWYARRAPPTTVRKLDRGFSLVLLTLGMVGQLYSMLPEQWDWQNSLPLHACDLAWMIASYALWTRRFWAFTITYYWGIVLVTQGLLTPPHLEPLPSLTTIFHFATHALTVVAGVYLTWGVGMRPNWRSFAIGFYVTVSCFIAVLTFNHFAGTNYWYVNGKLDTKSVLDLLGPWPWYVVVEIIVLFFVGLVLTVPWTMLAARANSTGSEPVPTGRDAFLPRET